MDSCIPLELKKMYSDSIFLNVFVFSGPKIKCIPESGEVIVSQNLLLTIHLVSGYQVSVHRGGLISICKRLISAPQTIWISIIFGYKVIIEYIVLRSLHQVFTKFHELLLIFESVRFIDILYIFHKMTWSSRNGEQIT